MGRGHAYSEKYFISIHGVRYEIYNKHTIYRGSKCIWENYQMRVNFKKRRKTRNHIYKLLQIQNTWIAGT